MRTHKDGWEISQKKVDAWKAENPRQVEAMENEAKTIKEKSQAPKLDDLLLENFVNAQDKSDDEKEVENLRKQFFASNPVADEATFQRLLPKLRSRSKKAIEQTSKHPLYRKL